IAVVGTGLKAVPGYGAGYAPGPRTFGTPAYIGELLLTRFLLAFEVASMLLLIAAVGGVVLAARAGRPLAIGERRGGDGEPGEEAGAPLDLPRPPGTCTMAETVGGRSWPSPGIWPSRRSCSRSAGWV